MICVTVACHVYVLLRFISEHVALTFEEHESSGKSTQKCGWRRPHTKLGPEGTCSGRSLLSSMSGCSTEGPRPPPSPQALVPGHTPEKGQKRGHRVF